MGGIFKMKLNTIKNEKYLNIFKTITYTYYILIIKKVSIGKLVIYSLPLNNSLPILPMVYMLIVEKKMSVLVIRYCVLRSLFLFFHLFSKQISVVWEVQKSVRFLLYFLIICYIFSTILVGLSLFSLKKNY